MKQMFTWQWEKGFHKPSYPLYSIIKTVTEMAGGKKDELKTQQTRGKPIKTSPVYYQNGIIMVYCVTLIFL